MEFEQYHDAGGAIVIPDRTTLVDFVEANVSAARQDPAHDGLVYRYIDYSTSRDGEVHELSWTRFGERLYAIAARLQQVAKPGDRVAILAPQGLDYIVSFFAAIQAGLIAVPLFDPDEPGHHDRLHAVLGDCAPAVILTSTESAAGVRKLFRELPARERPRTVAVDAIPDELGSGWSRPDLGADDIAYLQYTSGSTRVPAGVEITHRNVVTNVMQLFDSLGLTRASRGVTWLPLFHDMGLLTVILPAMGGATITVMSPRAFVQRPGRWVSQLGAASGGDGVFAAAPNFAFEHAARRGLPREGETLDLSGVTSIINGSEPVTPASMRAFNEAFAPYGLAPTVIKPSYGMAEATLFVSSPRRDDEAIVIHVDRTDLNRGVMTVLEPSQVEGNEDAIPQVACGYVAPSQWATIVEANIDEATGEHDGTGRELPEGRVGEIWLHGTNIGRAYWGRPEESEATFGNRLVERLQDGSKTVREFGTVPEDARWLRTGDYGAYVDGQLYITGRVKDLVIVAGRNHYPQDLENTAQSASDALRPGFVAAFSVPANQLPIEARNGAEIAADDSSETLVVVGERAPGAGKADPGPIADAVRSAISARHGVTAQDVLLVPAGSIPRTSSGKIARRACKAAYVDGTLRGGHQQTAFPDLPAQ
ncbi:MULTISPECIES: long-chain-fatty-acid--AMP ligase FadD32 [Dietzia]|uniref:Acyl-AMP synthetase n=1 Tax=Dietzia cinnamea TaxID=321318 RepID=A0AAW5Q841_9ACTN|nr:MULTISPECIES: long-chain-fatty-acid--AMP ligase FadD32 [Dietzia]KZO58825.1 fatty-acid--CoA ligase [Dietzia maris]MCT1640486.1 long-chain-fatty-acid--AMP ligase FadD32 [Dietzia cinnamea]MCT1864938.1 long-chain-fatty-acid--AMP ligase FadD32 [Dietzia cinnamea]MCT2030535.1 long-chain-fatty-acid--AMP ligase FadD32 [Dietzia cinnamea]MCT2034410.1 long-chain-fatty-acid--AMP ligase FadD32 [Dietzia cinnamea]